MSKYDDQMGLFPNKNRSSDKAPHYRGDVVLSMDTLKALVTMAKAGKEPKLSAAGWVNDWNGSKRLSVKVQPWEEREPKSVDNRQQVDPLNDPAVQQSEIDDLPF